MKRTIRRISPLPTNAPEGAELSSEFVETTQDDKNSIEVNKTSTGKIGFGVKLYFGEESIDADGAISKLQRIYAELEHRFGKAETNEK